MDTATRVQTLDESVCSLHNANTLGKGKKPEILPAAMNKYRDRLAL